MNSPKKMLRRGYHRKPYYRSDGTYVKGARIKPKYIKGSRQGRPMGKKLGIKVKQGSLGKYGYSDIKYLSSSERHSALKKAIKAYGALKVSQKLHFLTIVQIPHPSIQKKIKSDLKWLKERYRSQFKTL